MKSGYLLKLAVGLFVFISCIQLDAQTIHIQGEQIGVLQADTVMLMGDVRIPAGENLEFIPGTIVIATGYFGFEVEGSITALSDIENPVFFTVADTSGFFNPADGRGGWKGFHYLNTDPDADSSIFRHCHFEYGKAWGDSIEKMGGVFNIRQFGRIRISDCAFYHNKAAFWGGAIFGEMSNIMLQNCSFNDNFCGTPDPPYGYGGAVCFRYSTADITGCTFTGNRSTGIGGALSLEYSDAFIRVNIFKNNFSALGGALGYLRSTPARPVAGNLFEGNTSQFFGGAISFNRANPYFINNTITSNSSFSYGGGVYCNDSAVPVLINNIIYGNFAPEGRQVYIWDVNSAPEFYNCDVQGGVEAFGGTGGIGFNAPYLNNIDTLPIFTGIQPHPYALQLTSPCINSGNPDTTGLMLPLVDLAGNPRLSGIRIDIGAYEFQEGTASTEMAEIQESLTCWPNPFHNNLCIKTQWHNNETINISITDLTGRIIYSENKRNTETILIRPFSEDCRGIYPGVYLLIVSYGPHRIVEKLMYAG